MNAKRKQLNTTEFEPKNNVITDEESSNLKKENKTPTHIGHRFHKVRERKRYSLEEVSQVLRIGERYLEAIEEGNIEILPERVYTLGFVRAYAQFLGEKPDDCVKLFKQQILLENQTAQLNLPEALRKSTTPSKWYLIISAVIASSILLLWLFINSASREKQEIGDSLPAEKTLTRSEKNVPVQKQFQDLHSQKLEESNTSSTDSSPSTSSLAAEDTKNKISTPQTADEIASVGEKEIAATNQIANKDSSVEKNPQTNIKLICVEKTWVQIKDAEGSTLFVKTMEPGETYDVPPKEGLILWTGNAGGVNVAIGNEAPRSFGAKGEVKHNILLDAESLLSYLKAR